MSVLVELPGGWGGIYASAEAWQQVWRCTTGVECRADKPACGKPWFLPVLHFAAYSVVSVFHYCFPSVLWHCWLGDRKGIRPVKKTGCWLVGGNILTGALHVLWLQLSPPPPSSLAPIKSKMETFWYRLTQVHLENGRKNGEIVCFTIGWMPKRVCGLQWSKCDPLETQSNWWWSWPTLVKQQLRLSTASF